MGAAAGGAGIDPAAAIGVLAAVLAGLDAGAVGGLLDHDLVLLVLGRGGAGDGLGNLGGDRARDLEPALVLADADRADLVAGDVPAAADQRQQPARFGVLAAADAHAEPHHVLEAGTVAFGLRPVARLGGVGDQLLGCGHLGAQRLDQRGGDVLGRHLRHQLGAELAFVFVELARFGQPLDQPRAVLCADRLGGRCIEPFGLDLRAPQHAFDAAAAVVRHHQRGGALLARPAGAARTVLQRLGIARDLDMDHQAERGQVDPARGDIGGHADPRAPVAQRLQRLVALALRMLARQRDDAEAAVLQRGMQAAHAFARGAETDRGFRLVEAQQVDHRVLDLRRADGDCLIGDVAMPARLAGKRQAQCVALVAFGQPFDRARHGGGEQQRAARIGSRIEDFLEIFAEPHVEHLVGFVEHHADQARQVERAALEMVAQAAGRPDDNRRTGAQCTAFLAGIHPADAGGDA